MSDDYGVRSVILPFSGLEVQGKDYDEFFVNLVTALGSQDLADAYMGLRQFEVKKLVDDAGTAVTTTGSTVSPEQGVQNVKDGLGGTEVVVCPGHGEAAKKAQVKKDGANKNRWFYACARPQHDQCDFFKWA